jgi:hypothetical protein
MLHPLPHKVKYLMAPPANEKISCRQRQQEPCDPIMEKNTVRNTRKDVALFKKENFKRLSPSGFFIKQLH